MLTVEDYWLIAQLGLGAVVLAVCFNVCLATFVEMRREHRVNPHYVPETGREYELLGRALAVNDAVFECGFL